MNLMRKDGYRKALADAGIAFAEDHVIENVRSIHESYRVVTQLLKSGAGRIGLCMNMGPSCAGRHFGRRMTAAHASRKISALSDTTISILPNI